MSRALAIYTACMNTFVTALWRLLGGLTAVAAVLFASAAQPGATAQEPNPVPVWTIETLAPASTLYAAALDSRDRPHLIYASPDGFQYATQVDGVWQSEALPIDEGYNLTFANFDLAIAADDTPCLVYATSSPTDVHPLDTHTLYSCRDQAGWHLTAIADGSSKVQLVLDAHGQPHIALTQGNDAYYLTYRESQWWVEVIHASTSRVNLVSLLLDGAGQPHAIYTAAAGQFESVRRGLYDWPATPIPAAVGSPVAGALDSAGRLWLVVNQGRAEWGHPPFFSVKLLLAVRDTAGNWTTQPIDEAYDWFYEIALTTDVNDAAHVAYRDPAGQLVYAWWTDAGVVKHPVGVMADDQPLSVDLGSDGQARLAFTDSSQVRYATRGVAWLEAGAYLPSVVKGR